jgi:hypothetical protein
LELADGYLPSKALSLVEEWLKRNQKALLKIWKTQKVKNDIKTDEQAMNIALTEVISGRAPEQRGNGLKFVSKVVKMKNWYLYLQSGNGCIEISKGTAEFTTKPDYVYGCLAIIKY